MKMKIFSLILIFCANTLFAYRIFDLSVINIRDFYIQDKSKNNEIKNDCNKIVDKDGKLILPVESVNGILLQIVFDSDKNIKTGDIVKVFETINKKRIHKANGFVSSAKDSNATIEVVHFFNTTKVNEGDEVEFVYKRYFGESAGAFIKKYFSDSTFQECRTIYPLEIEVWKASINIPDEIVVFEPNSEFLEFRNLKSKQISMRYKLSEGKLEVHHRNTKGSGTSTKYIFEKKKSKYYLVKIIDKSLK